MKLQMKKTVKRVAACTLVLFTLFTPHANAALFETRGETAARYIKSIVTKIAEDYKYSADKVAMYESIMDYVMEQNPDLLEGAITAACDTLDDYSEYFSQDDLGDFVDYVEKAYIGIGVTITHDPSGLKITDVDPSGGAFAAGIQLDDIICRVDGVDVTQMNIDEATALVRGEENTQVTLEVLRKGEMHTVTVKRTRILAETVGYSVEEDVGYIYISKFASSTPNSVKSALSAIESQGIHKLIIDVRDNPGGELKSVRDVLSLFVPKGKVLTKIEYNEPSATLEIKSDASFALLPNRNILILTNKNSASAAEMFAGCMQDLGYAKTVGTTTFGKGCMQEFMGLINPYGFQLGDIKLTVAEFCKPGGGRIQDVGIVPDYKIKNSSRSFDDSALLPLTFSAKYQVGDTGADVQAIEQRLSALGYYTGNVDEVYDSFTERAVKSFQQDSGLCPYGVMDFTTQNALRDSLENLEVEVDEQYDYAFSLLRDLQ